MKKYHIGDVVYLKITHEEGIVKEIVTENDYLIIWRTGDRGIYNKDAFIEISGSEIPATC